jgi:hypothetical protein
VPRAPRHSIQGADEDPPILNFGRHRPRFVKERVEISRRKPLTKVPEHPLSPSVAGQPIVYESNSHRLSLAVGPWFWVGLSRTMVPAGYTENLGRGRGTLRRPRV